MSGYSAGVRVEHAVIHDLAAHGWDTIRAASSKGLADVVAIRAGQLLLVNCKRTTPPGPVERAGLLRVAAHLPGVAVPLVALWPARRPLTYRLVTGPGPRDWTPWTPAPLDEGGTP